MADDIPYNRVFELEKGRSQEVAPRGRRLGANNPSPFTFKGTVSYIVGRGNVAIVDPGPDDPAHIAAPLDAVRGETVTHLFVTPTHPAPFPSPPPARPSRPPSPPCSPRCAASPPPTSLSPIPIATIPRPCPRSRPRP